jgi:hypothetical protein
MDGFAFNERSDLGAWRLGERGARRKDKNRGDRGRGRKSERRRLAVRPALLRRLATDS